VLDGGSFQDGYGNNIAQGLAASEIHTFRNNLINEFRLDSITLIPIATISTTIPTLRNNCPFLPRRTLPSGREHRRPAFDQLQRWHRGRWQFRISACHRKAAQLRFHR